MRTWKEIIRQMKCDPHDYILLDKLESYTKMSHLYVCTKCGNFRKVKLRL
jgi:hypothetical protein